MNVNGFIEEKVLGSGTYGKVYKAKRESDGQSYAVKVVDISALNHREIQDSVNEIRIMASFTSPFIVRFYEAFCDNKHLYIITEYARLGDLAHLIARRKKRKKPFPETVIWRYFIQLLEGLKVLHSRGVVHRDLKSANILMAAPDLIKIADLGISTVLHTTQLARTQIGTPMYLAPEVWKRKPYDQKCDMWSLGVLLYEMMTFSYPFQGRTVSELSRRICNGRFAAPTGYSEDLFTVLKKLLQVQPERRPTASDLLQTKTLKDHMDLVEQVAVPDEAVDNQELLATIKVPLSLRYNLGVLNLPRGSYKKADIVKPMEQRFHLKKGVPLKTSMQLASSPELKKIADLDWWSPNKKGQVLDENEDGNGELKGRKPMGSGRDGGIRPSIESLARRPRPIVYVPKRRPSY